ncbi:MAG: SLBB domain-containing protein [Bacteroidota bacterium]
MPLADFWAVPRLTCCTLLALLLVPAGTQAQGLSGLTPETEAAFQQARRATLQRALTGDTVPLEGALDPDAYLVGPGDVFGVTIGTAIPLQLSLPVTAEGLLVVPDVGTFEVSGETLGEARRAVRTGLQRAYRNVQTEIALERPRQFYVHVAGTVTRPGRHVVVPVARVEDALSAAMDDTNPLFVLRQLRQAAALSGEPAFLPALRNVELRRRDGTAETVDLWRYYASGDLRFNPYLRDGDALYVPAFRDDLAAVAVEGEVSTPGSYDFRDGDTALDLLLIATDQADLDALGPVRLLRRGDAEGAQTLDAGALAAGLAENPSLQPGDRLLVMPRDLDAGVATVAGYVRYPGSYPVRSGETTLQDLVALAGSLRPGALARGAYLERRGATRSALYEPDQLTPFREIPLDAEIAPLAVQRAVEAEISELTRNSDLDFAGRQFYGRELLQPQRVSVDVAAALTGTGPAIPLRDGDRLVIPGDPQAVLVAGQVQRPGYVPVQAGRDADYYVEQAGGRSDAAEKTYVRDAGTGRIRLATDAPLASGDYVFVNRVGVGDTPAVQGIVLQERAIELQQEQNRTARRFQYIQAGLAAASAVASFITVYLSLTRD